MCWFWLGLAVITWTEKKNINVFELTMLIVVVFIFNVFELAIFNVFEIEEYGYLIFILIELLMFDYVWNGRKKY